MVFDDEEKDKEEGAISEDALEEVMDEDDDEDALEIAEGDEEGKDWA